MERTRIGPQSASAPKTDERTSLNVRVACAEIVYVFSGPVAPFPTCPRNLRLTLAVWVPVFMTTRSVFQKASLPLARAEEGRSHVPAQAGVEAATVTVFDLAFEPEAFATVSVTVKLPAEAKAWVGFRAVELPPSPKLHDHDVGLPVDASVKETVSPATGETGVNENSATGAGAEAATMTVFDLAFEPEAFATVSVTGEATGRGEGVGRVPCRRAPTVTEAPRPGRGAARWTCP